MRNQFLDFVAQSGRANPALLERIRGDRPHREPLGALAFRHGLIGGDEIDAILDEQRSAKRPFGKIAIERGFLTQQQVEDLLKLQSLNDVVEATESLIVTHTAPFDAAISALAAFVPQLIQAQATVSK